MERKILIVICSIVTIVLLICPGCFPSIKMIDITDKSLAGVGEDKISLIPMFLCEDWEEDRRVEDLSIERTLDFPQSLEEYQANPKKYAGKFKDIIPAGTEFRIVKVYHRKNPYAGEFNIFMIKFLSGKYRGKTFRIYGRFITQFEIYSDEYDQYSFGFQTFIRMARSQEYWNKKGSFHFDIPLWDLEGVDGETATVKAGGKDAKKVHVWIQRTADAAWSEYPIVSLDKLDTVSACYRWIVKPTSLEELDAVVTELNRLMAVETPGRPWPGLKVPRGAEDKHLAAVSKLKGLRWLNLRHSFLVGDAGLSHLAGLKQLQWLDLKQCLHVTDAGLAHLAGLKELQTLDLRLCKKITDAGLVHLSKLKQLRKLSLQWCSKITDTGLAHIVGLKELQQLALRGCEITDTGLSCVAKLKQLRKLDLYYCKKITDTGLSHLSGLKQLRELNLAWCTKITDAGLTHLFGLKQLRELDLAGFLKLTGAGVRALKKALPGCRVLHFKE